MAYLTIVDFTFKTCRCAWDLEFASYKTELKNKVTHYDVIKPSNVKL